MEKETEAYFIVMGVSNFRRHGRKVVADSGDNSNNFDLSSTELGEEMEKGKAELLNLSSRLTG